MTKFLTTEAIKNGLKLVTKMSTQISKFSAAFQISQTKKKFGHMT